MQSGGAADRGFRQPVERVVSWTALSISGAINWSFHSDGSLRDNYLKRIQRVFEACDRNEQTIERRRAE
jgi:hypothetical protein